MEELKDYFISLRENKPFICILFFAFYSFGLIGFYLEKFSLFSLMILFPLIFVLIFFRKHISVYFLCSLYLLFLIGFFNGKFHYTYTDDFLYTDYLKNAEITGVVITNPKHNTSSDTYKFSFKTLGLNAYNRDYKINNSTLMVSLKNFDNEASKIKYGNILKIKGNLTTPSSATNPSQFDYKNFLANKGILRTFYANKGEFEIIKTVDFKGAIQKEGLSNKITFLNYLLTTKMHDIRNKVIDVHSKYIKSPKLEILGGVVFGDDAINPPDDVKESFISSGLLHLLAASGLNVALILSVWLLILYYINISYRLKITSGIFMVFLYTLMTGCPPSVVRASVMLLIILIGKLIYREANGISLIFMAGFIILIFKPEYIADVGFQLSFLVTLGLIICIPPINHLLSNRNKNYYKKIKNFPKIVKSFLLIFSPTSICSAFIIPFVAQLWAGPLQAYYFNSFSTYSILANICVIPFIGIVSFLGFVSTIFCFIPKISNIVLPVFDGILNHTIGIILNISNFFSNLPNSMIRIPSPKVIGIVLFYITVILFFISLKYLFKKRILNIFLFISVVLLGVQYINLSESNSEVIFFNVGNADNALIKTKDNKYIMIDTGKFVYNGASSAKTITLEYLYDKNIKEIDTLIVTHYDSDHSGGLVDILKEIKVKNLILPKLECNSRNSCSIKEYIEANNIKYQTPYQKQTFIYDGNTKIVNYVPYKTDKGSKNDASTVTLATLGKYKFLFMADVGIKGYEMIDKYMEDIDVLKVAHHGAKNTVSHYMLNKIKPEYAIISTGKNPYGHPNKFTVMELKKKSKVLSTREYGAIKFVVDENLTPYSYNRKTNRFMEVKF